LNWNDLLQKQTRAHIKAMFSQIFKTVIIVFYFIFLIFFFFSYLLDDCIALTLRRDFYASEYMQ
jgi:hypothetical protein